MPHSFSDAFSGYCGRQISSCVVVVVVVVESFTANLFWSLHVGKVTGDRSSYQNGAAPIRFDSTMIMYKLGFGSPPSSQTLALPLPTKPSDYIMHMHRKSEPPLNSHVLETILPCASSMKGGLHPDVQRRSQTLMKFRISNRSPCHTTLYHTMSHKSKKKKENVVYLPGRFRHLIPKC